MLIQSPSPYILDTIGHTCTHSTSQRHENCIRPKTQGCHFVNFTHSILCNAHNVDEFSILSKKMLHHRYPANIVVIPVMFHLPLPPPHLRRTCTNYPSPAPPPMTSFIHLRFFKLLTSTVYQSRFSIHSSSDGCLHSRGRYVPDIVSLFPVPCVCLSLFYPHFLPCRGQTTYLISCVSVLIWVISKWYLFTRHDQMGQSQPLDMLYGPIANNSKKNPRTEGLFNGKFWLTFYPTMNWSTLTLEKTSDGLEC